MPSRNAEWLKAMGMPSEHKSGDVKMYKNGKSYELAETTASGKKRLHWRLVKDAGAKKKRLSPAIGSYKRSNVPKDLQDTLAVTNPPEVTTDKQHQQLCRLSGKGLRCVKGAGIGNETICTFNQKTNRCGPSSKEMAKHLAYVRKHDAVYRKHENFRKAQPS